MVLFSLFAHLLVQMFIERLPVSGEECFSNCWLKLGHSGKRAGLLPLYQGHCYYVIETWHLVRRIDNSTIKWSDLINSLKK